MDDELQYRCAGYIQAEIERYAEFLDESAEGEEKSELSGSEGDNGMDEGDEVDTHVKRRPAKKVRREGMCDLHAA